MFSGPIDLLVDEVRRQNVALEQIDLAPLTARFLDYLRQASLAHLNLDIEWLHMAATLIQWKSRALLPRDPDAPPDAIDPVRQEIIAQFQAHRKQIAAELARRKTGREASFSRPGDPRAQEDGEEEATPFVSVWDLTQQARDLARWVREYRTTAAHWRTTFDVQADPVTVAQMSQVLRARLAQAASLPIDALPLLEQQPSLGHRAALFLGLLEMVRDQEITAEQAEAFQSVWIGR